MRPCLHLYPMAQTHSTLTRKAKVYPLQPRHSPSVRPLEPARARIRTLFELPFPKLIVRAGNAHQRHFKQHQVQLSALCSIKTGLCAEDCAYCPQSARYHSQTGLEAKALLDPVEVERQAKAAKDNGADRFCMGAAWRSLPSRHLGKMTEMVARVKALGLQTCMTLGMLNAEQARALADSGLDYYNHNLDTSPEFYPKIISTRTYQDRLDTIGHVRASGMSVCSGGIVGMGESREDRVGLLAQLAALKPHSVPVNHLVRVKGTPLADAAPLDPFEFVRVIAVARIVMPQSWIRVSAGRETMSEELQALCFTAGANSIFLGEKLLTVNNRKTDLDQDLLERLGLATFNRPQEKPPATQTGTDD